MIKLSLEQWTSFVAITIGKSVNPNLLNNGESRNNVAVR